MLWTEWLLSWIQKESIRQLKDYLEGHGDIKNLQVKFKM